MRVGRAYGAGPAGDAVALLVRFGSEASRMARNDVRSDFSWRSLGEAAGRSIKLDKPQ
jgi:hypothetical protein